MNAPNSFVSGNTEAITSHSPQQRVVHAVVLDVRAKCAANADYQLTKQDVLDWVAKNGQIAPGSFVIMLTGCEDKWNDPKAFINQDAKGNLHFPGFAPSSAWRTWISCLPRGPP
jgi:kynurenine formamidase